MANTQNTQSKKGENNMYIVVKAIKNNGMIAVTLVTDTVQTCTSII